MKTKRRRRKIMFYYGIRMIDKEIRALDDLVNPKVITINPLTAHLSAQDFVAQFTPLFLEGDTDI